MSEQTLATRPARGAQTRERLMDLAEAAILQKGFAATSIEELIVEAGVSKSGFFYHFRDKQELGKALLERYIERDEAILNDLAARAAALTDDPLQEFLVFLKLMAEMLANLPEAHPGCLAASYCYQDQMFSRDVRELNAQGVLAWRVRFHAWLERIAERYPPRAEVDLQGLADMVATLVEGGIVLSKILRDGGLLPQQVLLYRSFVRQLFDPAAAAAQTGRI